MPLLTGGLQLNGGISARMHFLNLRILSIGDMTVT